MFTLGAAVGGDTTDDNYSSFRPPEPATRPIRPSRSTERSKKGHTGHTSMMGSGSAAVAAASKNRENTQFIPRPKIPLDPYNLATNNPAKFAEKLFAKLSKVEDEQAKDSKLRGKIIICNFISCFFSIFYCFFSNIFLKSFVIGMLEMNRTRSSLHDHTTHDLESGM